LGASADFETARKNWEKRAAREFPDLASIGTPMHSTYLERVKKLRAESSEDLKNPAWPYIVALRVNSEMLSKKPVSRTYTVAEVDSAITLPEYISVAGVVTRARYRLGTPLQIEIILEKKISCILDCSQFILGSVSNYTIIEEGDSAYLTLKTTRSSQGHAGFRKYYPGQKIVLFGVVDKSVSGRVTIRDCTER